MSDWKTIKIPPEEYERHNAKRQNLGETWAEYIDGQSPENDTLDIEDIRTVVEQVTRRVIRDEFGHREQL